MSTMVYVEVTCFKSSVSKDMKSMLHRKGDGSRKGNGTFMLSTNCEGIEN